MAVQVLDALTFHSAVDEGDYYHALGVRTDAQRVDIDAAAARMTRRMPDKARAISAVARVLTRSDAKAIYQSLCRLQAAVLRQLTTQCGPDCVESYYDCRRLIWRKCCDLLHFNLDDSNLPIGPRGAKSLAAEGWPWIADSILDLLLARVVPTDAEWRAGAAKRELWYAHCPQCERYRLIACRRTMGTAAASFNNGHTAERKSVFSKRKFWSSQYEFHLPLCRQCGTRLAEPSEYHQTFTFALSERVTTACVINRQWQFGPADRFRVFDSVNVTHPPSYVKDLYTRHQQGKDVTLAETRYVVKRKQVLAMASTLLVIPFCLALQFVMASFDDNTLLRFSNSEGIRRPETAPATTSFNDVMRKTAAVKSRMHLAKMAASEHPSGANTQEMIARGYLELADVYSTSSITRTLAPKFRQKAIEILEGLVGDNPNVPRYRQTLARAQRGCP
jgi:hypothetical protein